ncbi:MAG TPA: ribbon-helix-helix protein, CopG family [Candidatus Thermoplasmatota archaeon]|nr:ribbon-helix-helix protein, CopG family [Candidatus Thermoplasmatota archaeon]
MAEKQVLFRLEEDLLDRLDRKLAQRGYRTRNAWFRDVVRDFAGEGRKRRD